MDNKRVVCDRRRNATLMNNDKWHCNFMLVDSYIVFAALHFFDHLNAERFHCSQAANTLYRYTCERELWTLNTHSAIAITLAYLGYDLWAIFPNSHTHTQHTLEANKMQMQNMEIEAKNISMRHFVRCFFSSLSCFRQRRLHNQFIRSDLERGAQRQKIYFCSAFVTLDAGLRTRLEIHNAINDNIHDAQMTTKKYSIRSFYAAKLVRWSSRTWFFCCSTSSRIRSVA